MARELATYTTESGTDISLTDELIRNVVSTDPNVTDKEILLFASLCKAQRLNPFVNEAYLIKYGNSPATMVVSKDVFTKRAQRNPRFKGFTAGVTVLRTDPDGTPRLTRRSGSMVLAGEELVGGWCSVYIDGYEEPMFEEVAFKEYAGYRKDGSLNSTWAGKPGTMIRKVAITHALREAFPEDLAGLYEAAEMGVAERDTLPDLKQEAEIIDLPASDTDTTMSF